MVPFGTIWYFLVLKIKTGYYRLLQVTTCYYRLLQVTKGYYKLLKIKQYCKLFFNYLPGGSFEEFIHFLEFFLPVFMNSILYLNFDFNPPMYPTNTDTVDNPVIVYITCYLDIITPKWITLANVYFYNNICRHISSRIYELNPSQVLVQTIKLSTNYDFLWC